MRVLDANIFLRYITRDNPQQSEACRRLFEQVRTGDLRVATSEGIIAEVIYVLTSPRLYRLPREQAAASLLPLVKLRGLRVPRKDVCVRALRLYAQYPFLDFADALVVAHAEREPEREVVGFDRDLDRLPGVRRVEP
ncbi:MAG TPA: PIN domain-containing protein [Dehalococcoidia bacterium]